MGESLLSLGGCVCGFSSFHMEIIAGTGSSSSAGRGWDGSKSERRALLGLPPRRAGPGWKENRGGKWILGGMCPTTPHAALPSGSRMPQRAGAAC